MWSRSVSRFALAALLLAGCRQHRIVLVGDSNTQGFGASSPEATVAAQLDQQLGGDYQVWGFGLGGLGYLWWWNTPGNTPARNLADTTAPAWLPEYEVLLLGSNDLNKGSSVADIVAEATYEHAQLTAFGIHTLVVGHLYPNANGAALDSALASAMGADYVPPPAFQESDYIEAAGQTHVHLNDVGLGKLASALKAKIAP